MDDLDKRDPTTNTDNPSPIIADIDADDETSSLPPLPDDLDSLRDEIFSLIRYIQDPEHQLSLEQLGVVKKKHISFNLIHPHSTSTLLSSTTPYSILIEFIPTVPHCSLARLIGLCIRSTVQQHIPEIKLDVQILPGTHNTIDDINKQLADKERCCAALEQPALADKVKELTNHRPE